MSRSSRERARYRNSQNRNRARSNSAYANEQARAAGPVLGAPALPGTAGNPGLPDTYTRPPDPYEIAAQAAAQRNSASADAQAGFDRANISSQYGFGANGAVDTTNPYSLAALNERHYKESTRGNTNSLAGQGQLYSGALQNAQNASTFGYLTDRDRLQKGQAQATGQTYLNQLSAGASGSDQKSQAALSAILRALGQG